MIAWLQETLKKRDDIFSDNINLNWVYHGCHLKESEYALFNFGSGKIPPNISPAIFNNVI